MSSFGPAYDSRLDGERLATKQIKVRDFMLETRDGYQTLDEIRTRLEARHGERFPAPSLSAFLRHLRKRQFGSFILEKRRRGQHTAGIWEYRLLTPKPTTSVQDSLFAGAAHA